ncbi:hypothetical protein BDN71DRAFT_1451458 [Pleurotus eryngii]|uniref:Uncharacterized protein n=1 Tax=Pleurotus eryngii TaxID=5323 RepID=A0A9P6DEH8_PLEER|nr:hypothetical protein BDN71DRAFT_1451458 [Pleurotus eryngii]
MSSRTETSVIAMNRRSNFLFSHAIRVGHKERYATHHIPMKKASALLRIPKFNNETDIEN